MSNNGATVISVDPREAHLKRKLRTHLHSLGFTKSHSGVLQASVGSKDSIRALHAAQRAERLSASAKFVDISGAKLMKFFASGKDVDPKKISPVLERIKSGTWQSDLFRLASLTWSVPVSNGFGRRLRYLVWDESNGKLIGLIAVGDPVFNLGVRDKAIGWDVEARGARLVNLMDAYVLGAVPPYNLLLGGKLIACLLRSRDLYEDFANTYGNGVGVISQKEKNARLLAVTTSSSMGRSSVYNRLNLDGVKYLEPLGYTLGWGHFHIPDELFSQLRDYLRDAEHSYADQHAFGQGPNWRLRTMKAALAKLGFKGNLMRHGIQRQVFICNLAENASQILRTGRGAPEISSLLTAKEIAEHALNRWVIPRSERRREYSDWTPHDLIDLFGNQARGLREQLEKVNVVG